LNERGRTNKWHRKNVIEAIERSSALLRQIKKRRDNVDIHIEQGVITNLKKD